MRRRANNLKPPKQQQKVPGWWAANLLGMLIGSLVFLSIDSIHKAGISSRRSLSILIDDNTPRPLSDQPTIATTDSNANNEGDPAIEKANNEGDPAIEKAILNNPGRLIDHGILQRIVDMTNFTKMTPFNAETDKDTRGNDNEAFDAVTRYFWGQESGLVLELGGLDGKRFSVSADFLPFHWHRVLIEASPQFALKGPQRSPDATFVHSAICQKDQEPNSHLRHGYSKPVSKSVHYLQDLDDGPGHDGSTNGIGEFMTKPFLRRFHNRIFRATSDGTDFEAVSDWKAWNREQQRRGFKVQIDEIPCLDLASIFSHLDIDHINFFVLDVEGGELSVLQTIDWDAVRIDVLVVETEPFDTKYRPIGYADSVRDFMLERDYVFERNQGRNSWFRHPSFNPSAKPDGDLEARNKLKNCIYDEANKRLISCRNPNGH